MCVGPNCKSGWLPGLDTLDAIETLQMDSLAVFNDNLSLSSYNLSEPMNDLSEFLFSEQKRKDRHSFSQYFYSVMTPIVVMIGLVGNTLCIRIFSMRKMRRQVSSVYFAAMSASDILVLILYVLPEWLQRGLGPLLHARQIQVIGMPAWCQVFLYTSYSMRIMSVWMLVTSTVERYVGVCYPLKRRRICSIPSAKRIIATVITASAVLTLWKPLMSESTRPDSYKHSGLTSHEASNSSETLRAKSQPEPSHCAPRPNMKMVSFVLDSLYAACLSIIPSLIILCINIAISRRLLMWRKKSYESETDCISHQEALGVQFAGLLVLISTTYLLVTWPYYICWIRLWYLTSLKVLQQTSGEDQGSEGRIRGGLHDALHVTRTIFYLNYSVNYFLYSFASRYFRSEMKRIFTMRARRRSARQYYESTELGGQCVSHQRPMHTIETNQEHMIQGVKVNYV